MTSDPHLDPLALRRLLRGELSPGEARRLAGHLARECPDCEAVIAADPALDERVDRALASLAPPRDEERGDDLEFARIQRAVRQAKARPSRRLGVIAAAALVAIGAGVVLRLERAPRSDWTGEKGRAGTAVPAKLRFAVAGGPGLERGATGQVLPPEASLLFRIEVGAPAYVALVRVGGSDREVVFQGHADRPGAMDVSVNGRPAAYPLHGLSGPQRFVLVAGTRPIEERHLAEAARVIQGQAATREPRSPELSIDVVEITVR
jgi:hypothetical protein